MTKITKLKTPFTLFFSIFSFVLFSQDIKPLTDKNHNYGKTDFEKEWFKDIESSLEQLDYNGYLLEDDSLNNYVNQLAKKLLPAELSEFTISVKIIKSPKINAGMYPNGVLKINTGLLGFLENEAELAFIICHEFAHFIYRHQLRQAYVDQDIMGTTAKPTYRGYQSYLAKRKEVFAFNRALEKEADYFGLEIFRKTNYDLTAAITALQRLPSPDPRREKTKIERWLLHLPPPLPSHPKSEERVSYLKEEIKNPQKKGIINAARYQRLVKELPKLNVDLMKMKGESFILLEWIDSLQLNLSDSSSIYFRKLELTKGEIYQELIADDFNTGYYFAQERAFKKRGNRRTLITNNGAKKIFKEELPQLKKSALDILTPLLDDKELGYLAHRAIGLTYYLTEEDDKAKFHLNEYLESNNEIEDKRLINSVLKNMN